MTLLIFLDTETTGLNERNHRPWEVAWQLYHHQDATDLEPAKLVALTPMRQMFLAIDEVTWKFSDPQALIIGKLHDRYPDIQRLRDSAERNVWVRSTLPTAADCLEAIMADLRHNGWATPRDATLVGACPWFDDTMLAHAWRHSVNDRPWHYHLVDIETLAAGWVGAGPPPWRYGDLLAKLGVDDPETGKHTAAGDVQVVVQAYAKVYDLTIEDLA